MYSLTIDELPKYPARFFQLGKSLSSLREKAYAYFDSFRIAIELSAYKWQQIESVKYLAASVDYADFECRVKTLKYLGKF